MLKQKISLYILLFLVVAYQAQSQDANNLALDATVKDQAGGKLTSVDVTLLQDGVLVNRVKTGKNGRFDLLLDFDHEYIIEASKPGYISKKMYVNTRNVPEDEQLWGYEYGGFAIDLFQSIEGVDFSILEKPVAKIYYDPNLQNFDYDKMYTKQIKAELDALIADYEKKEKLQEQILKQINEDYAIAIKDAERAVEDGDYLAAKENYLAASSLKPSEQLPKSKIIEIDKKLSAASNKEEQYMSVLATADQLFGSQKYLEAKAKYQEAKNIKPSEKYPQDRIVKSEKAFVELKAKQEAEALLAEKDRNYNQEIAKADKEFTAKNYKNARTYYQNALGYKAEETYPKNQLAAIEQLIKEADEKARREGEMAVLNEKYNAQIAKADAAFNSKNYSNAQIAYEAAAKIKSDETYPKEQLDKIDSLLKELQLASKEKEEQDRLNQEYSSAINMADKAFIGKNYTLAKESYAKALAIKAEETHPRKRLEEIEQILTELASRQEDETKKQKQEEEYAALIAEGDASYKSKDFEKAKDSYASALLIKQNEVYPTTQLKLIEDRIKEENANKAFEMIVKQGDEEFASEKYEIAKNSYTSALALRPNHSYSKNQIAEIEKRLLALNNEANEQAKRIADQKKYDDLIEEGDRLFNNGEYTTAIKQYQDALTVKPNEAFPIAQIAEANKRIKENEAALASASELEKKNAKYKALIEEADALFGKESYSQALTIYKNALVVKSSESYPKERIIAIEKILEDLAQKEANEKEQRLMAENEQKRKKEFDALIVEADGYLDSEDYLNAKARYQKANDLLPAEQYPSQQIKIIDQKLKELDDLASRNEKQRNEYFKLIEKGDRSVVDKDWANARISFESALALFPDELIPAARLKEIDALEEKEQQELLSTKFNQLVNAADQAFLVKDYEAALNSYNSALELFPENGHCLARKEKIFELLNKQEELTVVEKDMTRRVEEENFEEGNAKVTIRKVSVGSKVDVYKRVVHSWGGKYYFLNDQPIPELVWSRDTAE